MKYLTKASGKELKILHTKWEASYLPWDLRTVFDLDLSFEDIQLLESDGVMGCGDIIMMLVNEGER